MKKCQDNSEEIFNQPWTYYLPSLIKAGLKQMGCLMWSHSHGHAHIMFLIDVLYQSSALMMTHPLKQTSDK